MSRDNKRKRAPVSQRSPPSKKLKHADPLKVMRGDSLKWKQVALPDRLEDAEGFYGLEEIEDVEVIRDERNHVMFRPTTNEQAAEADGAKSDAAESEWHGFNDGANGKVKAAMTTNSQKAPKPGILKRPQEISVSSATGDGLSGLSLRCVVIHGQGGRRRLSMGGDEPVPGSVGRNIAPQIHKPDCDTIIGYSSYSRGQRRDWEGGDRFWKDTGVRNSHH